MNEQIWKRIADLETPGFFITADIMREDVASPLKLEDFICQKLVQIRQGITGRKFTFREGKWRILMTFFPTDQVVEERYALKNRVMKLRKS